MQILLEVMFDLCFFGEAFKRRVFYIFYEKHSHGSKRVVVLLCLLRKKKTLAVVLFLFNVEVFTSIMSRKQLDLLC